VSLPFKPTPDVTVLINSLLDIYERRGGAPKQVVRVDLEAFREILPGYYSQVDPIPRTTANEQLRDLERRGLLALRWQPGQEEHLLEAVALTERVEPLYALVARTSLTDHRRRLRVLLLGDRFRLDGWRRLAVDHYLEQLKARKSPTPFDLDDDDWNRDLLAALVALPDDPKEEIPYRVFSVRVFNDSKRFDTLKRGIARLARRHHAEWRALSNREALRELGLVANPGHLYLYGPWRLVDPHGQVMSLSEFYPSVGIPSALAGRVVQARVSVSRVICVENLTPFYELVRHEEHDMAAVCLWGNPSPACRHLLGRLVEGLAPELSLQLWADIDYGGLNILAQLRTYISPRFVPYRMDIATLDTYAHWAQPLTASDARNLDRLRTHPALADMVSLIEHMLREDIKLEQEAIDLG